MAELELHSPAFEDHGMMPRRMSARAENLRPPLRWSEPPPGTEQLVLLCEDQDSPGQPFLHWLVTEIDPSARGTEEGAEPPGGLEWPNQLGTVGWSGPAPPPGDDPHRYVFRLYAMPHPPRLPHRLRSFDVHRALDNEALATGTLVGRFAD